MLSIKSYLQKILVIIFSLLFVGQAIAVQCDAIFPGDKTFAVNGSNFFFSFFSSSTCNAASCTPVPTFTTATIPLSASIGTFNQTTITSGEYFYSDWDTNRTNVVFSGSGTAVLYFKGNLTIPNFTSFNVAGSPNNVLIVVDGALSVGYGSNIKANFYVSGSSIVGNLFNTTKISGAMSVAGSLSVYGTGVFDFSPENISNMNTYGFCEAAIPIVPIVNYRFDECSYTGVAGDVLDQTGNYSATSHGVPDPVDDAKIITSLDLTATGTNDWVSVPNNTVNGLDDFTVSVWLKTARKKDQQEIFHALGRNTGDDELEIFLKKDKEVYIKVRDNSDKLKSSTKLTDNQWHHLVLTRTGKDVCLFVDGNLEDCGNGVNSGTLSVPNSNAIVIGQEQDSFGGGFSSSQSFEGKLDEFMIFDSVLSATQVTDIYNNQQSGNNYDGTVRAPQACEPLLELRFDESSWLTSPIIDEIGNFTASAIGGANTDSTNSAKITDISGLGTCGYGVFDGVNDYVVIPDDNRLDLTTEFSISVWINPKTHPPSGLHTIISKDTNFEFHLNSSGRLLWWWSGDSFESSSQIPLNSWTHIVIAYKRGRQVIYINGIENNSRSYNGNLLANTEPFYIGRDVGFDTPSNNRFFDGDIDEVRVYDYVLSASEVSTVYNATHPCPAPALDHFEIIHDGQGITCAVEPITIKACADVSCSVLSQDNVNVQLSVNGSPKKTVTVSGGTLNTNFSHVVLGNATLSLDQTFECKNGASTSCDVNFSDSGFIFGNDTNSSPAIPTQLSGKSSSIGFNGQNLFIQAVKTNTNTMACEGVFPNGGDIPVNLSYTCAGGNCQNLPLTSNGNAYNLTTTPSAHSLRFTTDSKAYFTLNYPDAAKFSISAQKDIQVTDDQGNSEIKSFSATSNDFVVRPFGFALDFSQDANAIAVDANGSTFKKAGENFNLRATAVQWVNGEDTNNDGIPDDFSALSDNAIANHFANENLAIIPSLVLPNIVDGGILGTLTPVVSNSFINSVVDNTYAYQEVGIINLAVSIADSDYLGAGDIQGQVANVGRFYPDSFTFSNIENGTLQSTCDVGVETVIPYAYSGQRSAVDNNKGSIRFNTLSSVTLTPLTTAGGQIQNYFGNFFKLQPSDITRAPLTEDPVNNGKDGITPLALVANLSDVVFSNNTNNDGTFVLEYTVDDNFYYTHNANAEVSPVNASIHSQINSIEDIDGAIAQDNDSDTSNGILTFSPDGSSVLIRFGRMAVENSYGPETSDLMQTIKAEYLNVSGQFVTNTDDSCTPFNSTNVTLTNNTIAPNGLTGASSGQLSEGITQSIILNATNVQGAVNVEYSAPTWLRYDWLRTGSDGTLKQNPLGVATFGLFRGNDRVIYWREVSN